MMTLVAYCRQRLPLQVFGPTIAGLALLAWWPSNASANTGSLSLALASVAMFVVRYRLWDDLADRERDRSRHPDRVSVRHHARPLAIARHVLFSGHVALFVGAAAFGALAGLLIVEVAFVAAYHWRDRMPPAWWRLPVLLAKYPAFVVVTGLAWLPADPSWLASAALVAYAAAWIYESLHDPRPHGVLS